MSFLTPTILDQLSPLIELKQWLSCLSIMKESVSLSRPILLEPILEIKEEILHQTGGNWKEIAMKQLPVIFCNDKETLIGSAKM